MTAKSQQQVVTVPLSSLYLFEIIQCSVPGLFLKRPKRDSADGPDLNSILVKSAYYICRLSYWQI